MLTYSNPEKTITLTLEQQYSGSPMMEKMWYCLILRGNGCAFDVLARDSDLHYLEIKAANIADVLGLKYCGMSDGIELPKQNIHADYLEFHRG